MTFYFGLLTVYNSPVKIVSGNTTDMTVKPDSGVSNCENYKLNKLKTIHGTKPTSCRSADHQRHRPYRIFWHLGASEGNWSHILKKQGRRYGLPWMCCCQRVKAGGMAYNTIQTVYSNSECNIHVLSSLVFLHHPVF